MIGQTSKVTKLGMQYGQAANITLLLEDHHFIAPISFLMCAIVKIVNNWISSNGEWLFEWTSSFLLLPSHPYLFFPIQYLLILLISCFVSMLPKPKLQELLYYHLTISWNNLPTLQLLTFVSGS